MHLEFLVEETSAEAVLQNIVPKVVGQTISFRIHPFQGKSDLLKKLPARLKGYKNWIPKDWRIVVLVDRDREDCRQLKAKMEMVAQRVGFKTKSMSPGSSNFQVLNRLAIEELEAWFFGDIAAVHSAFLRIPINLGGRANYRDPDAIPGGTWEALERVFKRAGYYREGLNKLAAARAISLHMDPERNRSHSFQVFREGLKDTIRKY
jgi:hypothetical protein